MSRRLEREVRLWSGLVVATFVFVHLTNHALGVVSLDAMDAMREHLAPVWRSVPGSALLYGALLVHILLAFRSLLRRTTLRMPAWEALQLGLGLLVPFLLIGHLIDTRLTWQVLGHEVNYVRVVSVIWSDPVDAVLQCTLLVVVWLHLCVGLHYWLRLRPWYRRALPVLYGLALVLPTLAIAGFVGAGLTMAPVVSGMGGIEFFFPELANPDASAMRTLLTVVGAVGGGLVLLLVATLATREARRALGRRGGSFSVHHASGRRLDGVAGQSVLEVLRAARVPHASICGGRARCTTCRIRIGRGAGAVAAPSPLEANALRRIAAAPNVRLACQTRPREDVWITPLLPADAGTVAANQPGGVQGREAEVAAMFVDLRESTKLGETRLPYDVVFILNQFFAEMSAALAATGGHYAQFHGDGLLALYGLDTDIGQGCRDALAGAAQMRRRLDRLNQSLAHELPAPLRIGIGVHCGVAIVGTMGPPDAPLVSAIGDNINVAARLESLTKELGCTLVLSTEAASHSGIDMTPFPPRETHVRGRGESVWVHAVEDPVSLVEGSGPADDLEG